MIKTITSTELQKKTREIIDWTRIKNEPVIIQTYGKPMATLLSYEEYQRYSQYKQARATRFARLQQSAKNNADSNTLTEMEAMALIEQERHALYEASLESGG